MTTFGRSTIPEFIQVTQPGYPSVGSRCNEYTGVRIGHQWERNGQFCVAMVPVTRTARSHTGYVFLLAYSGPTLAMQVKGLKEDELARSGLYCLPFTVYSLICFFSKVSLLPKYRYGLPVRDSFFGLVSASKRSKLMIYCVGSSSVILPVDFRILIVYCMR